MTTHTDALTPDQARMEGIRVRALQEVAAREVRLAIAELRGQGLSVKAIAELMGVTSGAVDQRLVRHRRFVAAGKERAVLPTTDYLAGSDDATPKPTTVKRLLTAHRQTTELSAERSRLAAVHGAAAASPRKHTPHKDADTILATLTAGQRETVARLRDALHAADTARMHSAVYREAAAQRNALVHTLHISGVNGETIAKLTGLTPSWISRILKGGN